MNDTASGLVLQHVSKSYGTTAALSDVSLTIERGSVVALVGHNGAGKSTLLRSLSGAERPDRGTILVDGEEVSFAGPSDATAAGIACVYQELSLIDQLTVAQNLFLGRESVTAGRLNRREMNAAADRLCAEYGIPARGTDPVEGLPVAQKQMIEVIRAVNRGSRYLLLDEPTTALEQQQVEELFATIRRLTRERGLGVLFVDHKLDEVFAVADHVVGLANGRTVLDGGVDTVDRAAVIRAVVGDRAAHEIGADAESPREEPPVASGALVFSAEHVAGPRLSDVSLAVHAGEVVGIYGLVGAGRTRFLRTVYGVEPRTGGVMSLGGAPYTPRRPRDAIRAGVAFVAEERKTDGIFPQLSARDNVVLPVLQRFARAGWLQWNRLHESAAESLRRVQVRGDETLPVTSLSGGNQQKVLFARATLQAPRLLLLDEPTKGVDIGAKSEIYAIIRGLAREKGVAVLVVSTEEEELITVADRIVVFRAGATDGASHPSHALSPAELRELAWADADLQETASAG